MSKKILVLGATGHVGQHLVQALVAKGEQVKAASRSGKPVPGAEAVVFDHSQAHTFAAAFDGVDRAFVMLPGGYVNAEAMLLPVIQAAAERRVKVVLQSVIRADADESTPYRRVEMALEKSGTPYVILRPNWFSDNFHTFWKAGIDHGQIALPAGEGRSSFIDVRDIADSAAEALTSTRFDGQAFNLTGPEALSYAQAAQILSAETGKTISYTPIEDAAFLTMLTTHGVPEDYARFLTSLFHPVREGWTATVTGDVSTLTGKAARSLQTYVKDHADALR